MTGPEMIKLETIYDVGMVPLGMEAESNKGIHRLLHETIRAYQVLYGKKGFSMPWVGYLAKAGEYYVGTCGFKGPPVNNSVEITYFTFPGFERRGYAQIMARNLVNLAVNTDAEINILSKTLPRFTASTSVLSKTGFQKIGMVEDPVDGNVWEWMYAVT